MDDPDLASYIILFFLLVLSAIFSGSETALVSLTPAKIKAMKPGKRRSIRLIARLKENPQKMLTTILLGNNIVNVAATAYATVLAEKIFENNAITIVTAVMTAAILVFGEILPKAIANRYAAGFGRVVIYLLLVIEIVFYPLIWILEKFISGLLKFFGETDIKAVTEDELKAMVSIGAEEGSLEKHEQELIENVLEFNDIEVATIMTPRVKIFGFSDDLTLKEAVDQTLEHNWSRIPIYHEQIDNVVGVLSVKDIFKLSQKSENMSMKLADLELHEVVKCAITRKIHSLFKELQMRRQHMAFIFDEHGGLEGLVTMEDILEELVGEIMDEDDEQEEEEVQRLDNQTIVVTGTTDLREVEEALNVRLDPSIDHNDLISRAILDALNRFPRKGEIIKIGKVLECKVVQISADKTVIEKVRVKRV